jgi:hypothetical protein
MKEIPLKPVANQSLTYVDNNLIFNIKLYTMSDYLYFDLGVNGTTITQTTICRNIAPLIKQRYLGYRGNFAFLDTQGQSDPVYTGLGSRFVLLSLDEAESGKFF